MAKDTQTVEQPPVVAMSQDQLAALIANVQSNQQGPVGGNVADFAKALAEALEEAQMKWKPHEKKVSPSISVYSHPEGERVKPKNKLQCHVYMGSYPLGDPGDNRTLTPEEVDAINSLRPGHYRITRMDGAAVVIELKGQVNARQEVERLWILYPQGDAQNKNLYPGLVSLAAQCVEANRVRNPLVAA